ncbi:MAG: hypothetical protein ACRYGL_00425 [Janthinobacterium lividum]
MPLPSTRAAAPARTSFDDDGIAERNDDSDDAGGSAAPARSAPWDAAGAPLPDPPRAGGQNDGRAVPRDAGQGSR